MKFSEPQPGYSTRSIVVTEIPTIGVSTVIDQMTIAINYTGEGSATKGIALDSYVMPLIKAAPALLAACQLALREILDQHGGRNAYGMSIDDERHPWSGIVRMLRDEIIKAGATP